MSKPEYTLLRMAEISDEARKIAVSWVENYEPMGYDLPGKQKLASDIMNYSKWENATLLEELTKYRTALGRISHISHDNGVEGCTWGDTDYDSQSVAFGYNNALEVVKSIVEKALK